MKRPPGEDLFHQSHACLVTPFREVFFFKSRFFFFPFLLGNKEEELGLDGFTSQRTPSGKSPPRGGAGTEGSEGLEGRKRSWEKGAEH